MQRLHMFRPAIAMIELIFALVIMGIVLLSAPMLIQQSANSNTVVLQQESIAMIAAHTNAMMTYFWDEQNVNHPNNILQVTNGDAALDPKNPVLPANIIRLRSNAITVPLARKRGIDNNNILNATTTLGVDSDAGGISTGRNDVDDFQGLPATLTLQGTIIFSKNIDKSITITSTIQYADDATPDYTADPINFSTPFNNPFAVTGLGISPTSNVKLITTQLTTTAAATELQKNIVLHAFMCNIGGASPDIVGGK